MSICTVVLQVVNKWIKEYKNSLDKDEVKEEQVSCFTFVKHRIFADN